MINCFSKLAFGVALKNKTGTEIAKALKLIPDKHPMRHFQTDSGKEFYNPSVKKLMKSYNINHYSTRSDKKASVVERFNRKLKTIMWRKFTEQCTINLRRRKQLIKTYTP